MRKFMAILAAIVLAGAAAAQEATAEIRDAGGETIGLAVFTTEDMGLQVSIEFSNVLAAAGSVRALHLHEVGACEPDFEAAGAHFNPTGTEHGVDNPRGPHAGDMPNVVFDDFGNATYMHVFPLATLDEDEGTSIVAGEGTALVLHAAADDEVTDPAGNSGERIACGVVVLTPEP